MHLKTFQVCGLELKGKYWPAAVRDETDYIETPNSVARNNVSNHENTDYSATRKVIALHGWLDNCASLDTVASQLDAEVLCLDLAGHGQSSARAHMGAYNAWLDIPEILAVADQLGWETFDVLAHSRGAAIGFLLASVMPERVNNLICLDGILPFIGKADLAPQQMRESFEQVKKQMARPRHYYASFDDAVLVREKGVFPLSHQDALCLARHGVEQSERGFYWRYDFKASAASELRLTSEQVEAFASEIKANVFLHLASDGLFLTQPDLMTLLDRHTSWHQRHYVGDHHFHMSKCTDELVKAIHNDWGRYDEH